uniref:Polyprotein protein n=1 Tax=Solanum tuberosum TaxID=4113 RepID=M1DAP6_SOLTU
MTPTLDWVTILSTIVDTRTIDDKDAPETSGIPPATTGDVQRDDAGHAVSKTETDEEQIEVRNESATQTVLDETSTVAPSGSGVVSTSEATPGTEARDQIDASGIDAHIQTLTDKETV